MKRLITMCAAAIILSSCNKDVVRGSGDTITSERSVDGFSALNTSGSGKITITYAPQITVTVKGYSNLVSKYVTEVKNGVLYLHYEDHTVVRNDNLEVHITMPRFTALDMSGEASINATGSFEDTDALDIYSSGNAGVSIEHMNVDDYTISSSGNSDISTLGVASKHVKIEMSGNGKAAVSVSDKLNVHISGNGKVSYKGNPAELSSDISGNGTLVKL